MLVKFIVMITSQNIFISNHYVAHLKLIEFISPVLLIFLLLFLSRSDLNKKNERKGQKKEYTLRIVCPNCETH